MNISSEWRKVNSSFSNFRMMGSVFTIPNSFFTIFHRPVGQLSYAVSLSFSGKGGCPIMWLRARFSDLGRSSTVCGRGLVLSDAARITKTPQFSKRQAMLHGGNVRVFQRKQKIILSNTENSIGLSIGLGYMIFPRVTGRQRVRKKPERQKEKQLCIFQGGRYPIRQEKIIPKSLVSITPSRTGNNLPNMSQIYSSFDISRLVTDLNSTNKALLVRAEVRQDQGIVVIQHFCPFPIAEMVYSIRIVAGLITKPAWRFPTIRDLIPKHLFCRGGKFCSMIGWSCHLERWRKKGIGTLTILEEQKFTVVSTTKEQKGKRRLYTPEFETADYRTLEANRRLLSADFTISDEHT
ncbi:uncharacterized protein BDR25DRAFT_356812 [Lindgomyces ingoldianus]|uniref:Uncharacterized protein n=1 Tax=Lindgomyces ingoldianus TaxID=673940 RepID=A0ACB6QQ91_9PLEO|nr:uncharacterized protein BDR25DRAFT_356812 [Lindgomyces ingoldianus]KAF2469050.1 hypothetical protein BDR25DRAFT_356812 [Lindgomyces ingoldianus]